MPDQRRDLPFWVPSDTFSLGPVVVPVEPPLPEPCARTKLDGPALMALAEAQLAPLISRPFHIQETENAIFEGIACALDHPESAYRAVERHHIYAYPAHGEPEQYITWVKRGWAHIREEIRPGVIQMRRVWQHSTWHWQDLPDGPLQRVTLTLNETSLDDMALLYPPHGGYR